LTIKGTVVKIYKEATRSHHSSFAFIPIPFSNGFTVLERIAKDRDKGKGF